MNNDEAFDEVLKGLGEPVPDPADECEYDPKVDYSRFGSLDGRFINHNR